MPGPSGISTKTIGLLLAGVLTIVFVIIIWTSIANSPTAPSSRDDLFPSDPDEIPNVEDTQTGGAMFVTMVDPSDPTRVSATLKAERFEPIGEGRRRLDQPESWIYLKDGRSIKITAQYATMLMPDPNQPPDSGTLEGDIRIESFETTPPTGDPILIAEFDEPVEFERRYLRLRSLGHFNIRSDQFSFEGSDLTVILNELRNRVELVDVGQGDQIVIHRVTDPSTPPNTHPSPTGDNGSILPNPSDTSSDSPTQTTDSGTTQSPDRSTEIAGLEDIDEPSQPAPQSSQTQDLDINRYHIAFNDQVRIESIDKGFVLADIFDLWLTIQDGEIPNNSISPILFESSNAQIADGSTNEPIEQIESQPTESTPTTPSSSVQTSLPNNQTNNDIVITWSGPMKLRPIDDTLPPQLENNLVAAKLSGNPGSGIEFGAQEHELKGQAFSATYLATESIIELESAQSLKGIINISASQSGSLNASHVHANLAQGIIKFDRRGSLETSEQTQGEPNSKATIQWKNSASFQIARLDPSDTQSPLTDRLQSAHFDGNVIARQNGHTIGAKILDAQFDPSLPSSIALHSVNLKDGVLSSASRSILSGNSLDVSFEPDTDRTSIVPTTLISAGNVVARTPDQMLKSSTLDVTMTTDLSGKVIVKSASASGEESQPMRYTDSKRSTARALTLEADAINETMILTGSPASVGQGGSKVTGNHITLNAKSRGIIVEGPGTFEHQIAYESDSIDQQTSRNSKSTMGNLRAKWTESMRLDDARGSLVCEGNVHVVSTPDPLTLDTLNAQRVVLKLNPLPTRDPIARTNTPSKEEDRRLISARLFGHAPVGQDPIPAKVDSRKYDLNKPDRQLSQFYLEGAQLLLNNEKQTLEVPVPGRLVIMDRSNESTDPNETNENEESNTDPISPLNQSSQLTGFTWKDRLLLDRNSGNATITGGVIVKQKTLSTGQIATLQTDTLNARFESDSESDQSTTGIEQGAFTLIGIDAIGSVRFLYQGRELLADEANYDALEDSLFASAINNKLVTLYNDDQRAPISAKTMRWNLTDDRIQINAPTPTRINNNQSNP